MEAFLASFVVGFAYYSTYRDRRPNLGSCWFFCRNGYDNSARAVVGGNPTKFIKKRVIKEGV